MNYRIETIELCCGADNLCQAAPELFETAMRAVAAIGAGKTGDLSAQEIAEKVSFPADEIAGRVLAAWSLPKPYRLPTNIPVDTLAVLFDPKEASAEVFFV